MSETNRIEYKLELTSDLDIEKEVIAFLNYKEGGYIYIGVDKNGNTVGVDDVDTCMLRLKDRIKNYDERGKRLNENFKRSLELLTADGKLNYVAYLLADENNISIKLAKY